MAAAGRPVGRLVERLLGGPAAHPELLQQALTHRSASPVNNERLEFLGDAVLSLVIAEVLLERFPNADEGELSRRRAALVNQDALAAIARGLEIGDYLTLGAGEVRTGGHARDSILADALEALFGALYLDQGYARVRELLLDLFDEALAEVAARDVRKDPKTRLQEWLQGRRRSVPEYEVLDISGDDHAQRFRVRCRLRDADAQTVGEGSSRRRAEQAAAALMLGLIAPGERKVM